MDRFQFAIAGCCALQGLGSVWLHFWHRPATNEGRKLCNTLATINEARLQLESLEPPVQEWRTWRPARVDSQHKRAHLLLKIGPSRGCIMAEKRRVPTEGDAR
jgi:hypothetical protein